MTMSKSWRIGSYSKRSAYFTTSPVVGCRSFGARYQRSGLRARSDGTGSEKSKTNTPSLSRCAERAREERLDIRRFVQVHEAVERHDHERELATQTRRAHVALREREAFARRRRLLFEPAREIVEHRARQIHAVHVHARARDGERHAAVADAVFEHGSARRPRELDVVLNVVAAALVDARVIRGVRVVRERAGVAHGAELGERRGKRCLGSARHARPIRRATRRTTGSPSGLLRCIPARLRPTGG